MKTSTGFWMLLMFIIGANILASYCDVDEQYKTPEVVEYYLEDNRPISGMFFSTEYVTDEYEYDGEYCIRYDDADANMFDVEIVVDSATYQSVMAAIISGKEMVGNLVINNDFSSDEVEVFSFVSNLNE